MFANAAEDRITALEAALAAERAAVEAGLAALDQLGGALPSAPAAGEPPAREKRKPTGRRDLRNLKLPEQRVEVLDQLFEKLVREGKAERFGFEESRKVAWKRGGARMLVTARAKYRTVDAHGDSMIETTPMPPECFRRSFAAPSMLAHILAAERLAPGAARHEALTLSMTLARVATVSGGGVVTRRSAARTCGRNGPTGGAECTRSAAQGRSHAEDTHARGTPARATASALRKRPTHPARKVIGEHRRVTAPPPLFGKRPACGKA